LLTLAWLLMASTLALQADTTVVLGHAEKDLTGDGKPEILRVVGVGPTIYDLSVTFTIESAGKMIYQYNMARMTRMSGDTEGGKMRTPAQHRAQLKEFGPFFFDERKFTRPQEFVEFLRTSARRHIAEIPKVIEGDRQASDTVPGSVIWEEIQQAPVTIFRFSPGGDRIVAIGWHARTGRFYSLLSCC
jgi:hypothetical protein